MRNASDCSATRISPFNFNPLHHVFELLKIFSDQVQLVVANAGHCAERLEAPGSSCNTKMRLDRPCSPLAPTVEYMALAHWRSARPFQISNRRDRMGSRKKDKKKTKDRRETKLVKQNTTSSDYPKLHEEPSRAIAPGERVARYPPIFEAAANLIQREHRRAKPRKGGPVLKQENSPPHTFTYSSSFSSLPHPPLPPFPKIRRIEWMTTSQNQHVRPQATCNLTIGSHSDLHFSFSPCAWYSQHCDT